MKTLNNLYPFKVKVGHNSEVHSKSIQDYDSFLNGVSAEAIKEFAKFLIDKADGNRVSISDLLDLVKEMVGE